MEIGESVPIALVMMFAIPAFAVYVIAAQDLFGTGKVSTLLKCLLWGATGAFILSYLAEAALVRAGIGYATVVTLAAPVIEEAFKALLLVYLIRQPRFRYAVDGALYGFVVGIGFGVAESLVTYLSSSQGVLLADAVSRTLTAVLMHAAASALVGISLGRLRRARAGGRLTPALPGIGLAMLSHLAYNNIAYSLGGHAEALLLFGVIFGASSVMAIFLLVRQELDEEKARFSTALALDVGISTAERQAIQQLGDAAIEQALAELGSALGERNTVLIRRMFIVQANIGILKNNLSYPASERLRKVWLDELAQLLAEAERIRRELDVHVRAYLERTALDAIGEHTSRQSLSRQGRTMAHNFDVFMRVSRLAP